METYYVDVKVTGYEEVAVKANSAEEAAQAALDNYDFRKPISDLRAKVLEGSVMMNGVL